MERAQAATRCLRGTRMRYIDKSLAPGERSFPRQWPAVLVRRVGRVLLLGIIVVGVFIFIRAAIKMSTTDFAVTNRRVILKQGWLNRHTHELAVESVEGVRWINRSGRGCSATAALS